MRDAKHVYFLRPVNQRGPIKIGCSSAPIKRLRAVEIWSPVKLELIGSFAGGHQLEGALHLKFGKDWLHGEWFDWSSELQEIIDEINATGEKPVSLEILPYEDRERLRKTSRTKSRRSPEDTRKKIQLSAQIGSAERHAYGYYSVETLRPVEIQDIIRKQQGLGGNLPTSEDLALCRGYARHLRELPKAPRDMAAWHQWQGLKS